LKCLHFWGAICYHFFIFEILKAYKAVNNLQVTQNPHVGVGGAAHDVMDQF